MASLLEALKKANLVPEEKVKQAEAVKRQKLKKEAEHHETLAEFRAWSDIEEADKQEKFLRRASRETNKPSSRVGTKQYFDRFKK